MDVEVLEDSGNSITLQYDFPNYRMNDILVNGKIFKQPVLQGENFMMKSGYPALPDVSRHAMAPVMTHKWPCMKELATIKLRVMETGIPIPVAKPTTLKLITLFKQAIPITSELVDGRKRLAPERLQSIE
jgi:hypothetical protein